MLQVGIRLVSGITHPSLPPSVLSLVDWVTIERKWSTVNREFGKFRISKLLADMLSADKRTIFMF